jgi:hypothetical protein
MTVRAVDDYAAIRARLVELQRERETLAAEGAPDTGRQEQESPPRPNYRTTGPQRRFVPHETT